MKRYHPGQFPSVVSLLTPLVLIGLSLRILLTPLFYSIEYHMPYFPADEYGFNTADRMTWATYAVDYLVNDADISYLGELTFNDGSPLYGERELRHMEDVKNLVQACLRVWYLSAALLAILAILAVRNGWEFEYLQALKRGGGWMISFAAVLGMIAVAGILINPYIFWSFFSGFHRLFFDGDSWLFYYSDTLIRLFPIRFWQDAFLSAAIISLSAGAGLAFGIPSRRNQ